MAFDSFSSPSSLTSTRALVAELYQAHAQDLTALAARILKHKDADAEDVVHDAFIELMELEQFPTNPGKYLAGIVRRKAAAVVQLAGYDMPKE